MAFQDVKIQRKVNSPLPVVRTVYREPENPVRFAYQKLLREHDKTKRVYAIDPFVEVYTFRPNLFCIYTLSLDGMGDSWIFVINGPEKALVIDTSFGLGNLKGLIEQLIGEDKEYYVANTHCHYDHAYGNFQFDTVYCHEFEEPLIRERMNPHIWDYLFDENGKGIWADFDRNDLVKFREYNLVGVPDGYTFDLGGGHEVELVFLPGHSPGHCGFLDKKNRIFFPGDDCCVGAVGAGGGPRPGVPHGEYCTIEALAKEVRKVVNRMDEFDSLFPSHGPLETGPIMLVSLLEACEEVLADPNCYDVVQEREFQGVVRRSYGKRIFESGLLTYGPKGVYMDHECEIN